MKRVRSIFANCSLNIVLATRLVLQARFNYLAWRSDALAHGGALTVGS